MDLTDAKALLDRAKHHYDEFEALVGGGKLWHISDAYDPGAHEFAYSITIDRKRLVAAGPIVADCANNVSSALDHIAAAIARQQGHGRLDNLYFPWALNDEEFDRRVSKSEKILGVAACEAIRAARKKHWANAHHIEAAKQISRDGKHWALKPAIGKAHGINAVTRDAGAILLQVPVEKFGDSDTVEFYRSNEDLPPLRGWEVFVGLEIDGLGELPDSPSSIFPCAFRYVQGTLDALAEAHGPPVAA